MNEDLTLVRRVVRGDRDAEEQLVQCLYQPTFLAMRHLTRSREDAEDLTQQTFIKIKQNLHQFDGRSSLKTWAMRIGYREYLRLSKRRKNLSLSEHEQPETGFGEVDQADWLLDLLATLSDKQREAFVLCEVEELTVQEAARVMRVPTGTIKTRLFHARRILKQKIEQEEQIVRNVHVTES